MSERKDKNRMLKPGTAAELFGNKDHSHEDSVGIDQSLFEKRLEGLRDTQESVQGLSLWCQANKRHSSAIIETWLKILKKSPVEKRLTLFYLANDVVQHARRKNDPAVVNQWAFAVQKATPQVRTPSSVSSAIARIFKIWEERNVYSKETIADLMALLNNVSAKERVGEKKKPETYTASADKVAAFQSSTLISKVKLAYRLKSHLGITFKAKPFVHMDIETLKGSIKDRSHGMEVIQEIGQLVEQLKTSEAKLLSEVEERRKIVETAEIAIVHYENIRGEAKIVNSAYKNFTERVESTEDKVNDKLKSFEVMDIDLSPVPSPPPEAPSPPPDDDEFGLSSNWSGQPQAIRNDIMDAIKSSMQPTAAKGSLNSLYQPSSQSAINNSSVNMPYDQSLPSLASMQQQFQQSWGNNQENFAAMSAMIQQMLPGTNNYQAMQQQQYGTQGYASYPPPVQPTLPDVSSIPLPPAPSSDPPPPPSQDISHTQNFNSHIPISNISPLSAANPYYSYDTSMASADNNEYVPAPYYKNPQDLNSSMSYGSEYDSYNSTPVTPTSVNQGGRYQQYPGSSESNSSSHQNSMSVSPDFSNHSGAGYNSNLSPTGQHTTPSFDPMEMFASALSKNRNNSGPQQPPLDAMNSNTNALHTDPANTSPIKGVGYYPNYENFETPHNTSLNGGNGVEQYSPRKPGFFNPHRGTFGNNRTPRGHRGGRGFGFRGRGVPRGPLHGRGSF